MGPTPQSMLPPQAVSSMVRAGGDPNSLFPSAPLSTGMTPDAMGADPTLMQQPPAGSQAMNPTMPPSVPAPMPPVAPNGESSVQPMDNAAMIINSFAKFLESHNKLSHKTADAIINQIEANSSMQQPTV